MRHRARCHGRQRPPRAGCAARSVGPPDALLVTSLTNIRYLTGLHRIGGPAVRAARRSRGPADRRPLRPSRPANSSPPRDVDARVVIARRAGPGRAGPGDRAAAGAGRRLGLEAAHVSWARQQSLAARLVPGRRTGADRRPRRGAAPGKGRRASWPVWPRRPGSPTRPSTASAPSWLRASPRRRSAGALDFEMRRLGASGPSFETIVASGPNAAMPHHRPGSRRDPGRRSPW